ncbi:MAG TPA: DEAD/DEAH box helicase [Clostridia bacterium]|nr:DEAD/DEAH box helicase [Clostridia bacterium]
MGKIIKIADKEPDVLDSFNPIIRDWFTENIGEPSEPQRRGWPEIASGNNVLICAPTGSGKTFAAFLKCLDWICAVKKTGARNTGIRIVYISPLKALNNDIYRNLELPIEGIGKQAEAEGVELPHVEIAVRTGDTPQKERARMAKYPPDILITTPESLYIMLTSETYRKLFTTVEYLIVDEIHSICANKRGVHLAVTLERLEMTAGKPLKRIGLTATVNPLDEAAGFLAGNTAGPNNAVIPRNITIINCDKKRAFDLNVSLPVKDLKVLPGNTVWPSIYGELLALVRAHRSTLIFVNNRKIAEQVSAGLNMLNGEPFVKTHHGSISKEIRHELERQLKDGELTCLVATSSLELGIDIGSIDLVVQVSSPGSVSQVLQRIGRSGHRLDAVSKGVIIPKTRSDLLDSAFVSYQAKNYEIENIHVPQNCLDILAQQITSIACEGEQKAEDVYRIIKSSYPYRELPEKQFEDVLLMLSDPSPMDDPGSKKPRIIYDKGEGTVRSTPLGRRMCLMRGGTIPDKGNYTVYLMDGVKVGELQEEFVFESRLGDRFYLGSSVWRVEKIEKDRVIVSPSNASGAKIPFWIGDQILRTYETGKKRSEFLKQLESKYNAEGFYDYMSAECGLDRTAAENLRNYLADQIEDTRLLPGAGRIVCEHFSDETGDRRIIIHSPFGGRVNAPLAVLLHSKLAKLLNCRMEYIYNNDGMLFHIFGYNGKLSNLFSLIDREELENEVLDLLPDAPLFNINLRYNLTRSLLVDMQGFGKRTPLWIQRLRCAETAEAALKEPDHPAVVETYRECVNDIFDIRSLYDLVEKISLGNIKVMDVYTEKPSPFSAELIFNFWQIYQYTYDLPVAERRNQLLVNDRDFIRLAAGENGEYELLDPRAIKAVENELNNYKFGRKLTNADDLYYFIYSYGELKADPYGFKCFKEVDYDTVAAYLGQLEDQRRVVRISLNDNKESYWIAAEDYPHYCMASGRDPINTSIRYGLPGQETEAKAVELLSSYIFELSPKAEEAAVRIIRRHILYCGTFTPQELSYKYSMDMGMVKTALKTLMASGEALLLKQMEIPEECIYCHRKVYERIKKKTIQMARSDMKPKPPEVYCQYCFSRHLLNENVLPAEDKLLEVIKLLEGRFFPVSWWEDFIFPSRIAKYEPRMLDYLCSTGTVQWTCRTNGNTRESAFLISRDDASSYEASSGASTGASIGASFETSAEIIPFRSAEPAAGDLISVDYKSRLEFTLDDYEEKLLKLLDDRGACFLKDLSKLLSLAPADLLAKMERLVWYGIIANDSFSVIRYYADNERKNSPWTRYNTYPNMGRWYRISASAEDLEGSGKPEYIGRLLDRYGLLSKEIADIEKGRFSWSELYGWLKNNEFTSRIKRGFYLEGLSGIQFARDNDLEQIRQFDQPGQTESYITLCSCDPANAYRDILSAALPVRLPKHPGTAIVFENGRPVLIVREYGSTFQPLTDKQEVIEKAAACFVGSFQNRSLWVGKKNIFTEYWKESKETEPVKIEDSPVYDKLLECGYDRGYSGATLWRKSV